MSKAFDRELEFAEKDYNRSLTTGEITKNKDHSVFSPVYMKFAENSLTTASVLYELSSDEKKRYGGSTGLFVKPEKQEVIHVKQKDKIISTSYRKRKKYDDEEDDFNDFFGFKKKKKKNDRSTDLF